MISLIDSRNSRDLDSSPVEYVNTNIDSVPKFQKVQHETARCFTAEDENGFFEILYTNVQRFKLRLNANDICLAEVAIFYDFIGNEKSEDLFQLYEDNVNKVKASEVQSSCSASYLPEFII